MITGATAEHFLSCGSGGQWLKKELLQSNIKSHFGGASGSGGSSSGGGSSSASTTPSSNQLGKRDSHMSITMDPGLALREASLPPDSKKRKTDLTLEEAATESPVCRQQQLKDSNSNEEQIFKRAKGDITRTKAALKDLLRSRAIQPYLPAGFTAKDSEADEVACGIGASVVDLVLAIKQKGASATSIETTLKELVIALAVAEVGSAKAIRAFKYGSNPKVVYEITKFAEKAAFFRLIIVTFGWLNAKRGMGGMAQSPTNGTKQVTISLILRRGTT